MELNKLIARAIVVSSSDDGSTVFAADGTGGGSLEMKNPVVSGLIVKSPNDHRWQLTIDNAGVTTWTDLGV